MFTWNKMWCTTLRHVPPGTSYHKTDIPCYKAQRHAYTLRVAKVNVGMPYEDEDFIFTF